MIYNHFAPPQLSGFGIIQDMDVFDAGGTLTTGTTDNKAANYTAGLLTRATLSVFRDITVFGYFTDQGTILVNVLGDIPCTNNDPDYQEFHGCLLTGGVAILGGDTTTPLNEGNTGGKFIGTGIYGADHHTRADTDPLIPCLYVDLGITTTQQGRGFSFEGCNFRSVVNDAIILDHCNDISFLGGTTEFSEVVGIAGLDQRGEIVGTANTQNITIVGLAATGHLGLRALKNQIESNGHALQVLGVAGASLAAMLEMESMTLRAGSALTVTTNTITPTNSYHLIDATGSPTVKTIATTNLQDGQILVFRKSSGAGTATFDDTGNLAMAAATRALSSQSDTITFIKAGSNLFELSYADNA